MGRKLLSFSDKADIAVGIRAGHSHRQIGVEIGRDHTVVWRERGRNSTKTRGYKPVTANCKAEDRRQRLQVRKIDADPVLISRVKADLFQSRTLRQVAGRLRLEAADTSLGCMTKPPDAHGRTVSHEAIYLTMSM